jgi:hypothetical protein
LIEPPIVVTLAAAVALAVTGGAQFAADGHLVERGIASQYSPGVMQSVVRNRQGMGQLPDPLPPVDGYIAVGD